MGYRKGDRVHLIIGRQALEAEVLVASENGRSLALGFDGAARGGGLALGMLPVLLADDGTWREIVTHSIVEIRAAEAQPLDARAHLGDGDSALRELQVRAASADEQRTALVAAARALLRDRPDATHDCGEWIAGGRCELCERPAIVCPRCGRVSFHPQDITNRYCGACHRFHEVC